MTTAERGSPDRQRTASRFFAEPMREYVLQCLGRPVSVLQAGCLAPLRELGIAELAQGGFEISVTAVDADQPLARRVLLEAHSVYDDVITGDLRTVSIPQRAFNVVYCAALLERVRHVELVLDRLNGALKPGGLLFVRTADRYSATALLDRVLPGPARRAVWSRFRPGTPGPFPAVYEETVSQKGIASYALMRGLVIAARASELTRPDHPAGLSSSVRITCAAIARLSRGRYADSHDELLYVIRKPLDRFARVVLARGVADTPRRRRAWPVRSRPPTCCPRSWPRGRPGPRTRSSSASSSCSSPARSRRWPAISPRPTSRRSAARGQLADGTPWPVPVTLTVPAGAVPADAGHLVLQDPEGSPLAVLSIAERVPADASGAALRLAGPVTALRPPEHGPFRALRRTPAEVRARLGGSPVLAYATRRPLGQRQIGQLRHLAGQLRARILLLPLVAGPAELVTRPESLVRAVLAAGRQLPGDTLVVPVPLPPRAVPAEELRARTVVAAAYGATHLLREGGAGDGGAGVMAAPALVLLMISTFPSSAWRSWPRESGPLTRSPRCGGRSG